LKNSKSHCQQLSRLEHSQLQLDQFSEYESTLFFTDEKLFTVTLS